MRTAALRQRFLAREFHPELRWAARFLPASPITTGTVRVLRRIPQRVHRHPETSVCTLPSGIALRVHRPRAAVDGAGAALLWIHGGGYVLGTAAMDDRVCRRYANELGITVVAVDYRLAPEHPYPAALEDCYATLAWLAARPDVDPARIAVAGASAGGGLAAALAQVARDRAEIPIVAQVLLYPMLEDRTPYRDPERTLRRMWSTTSNTVGWRAYLGDADPALAVPARRVDLSGLAPAWIGVGELDVLSAEARNYAARLSEAGVHCQLEMIPGAFHGFDAVDPKATVSQAFFGSQCAMLRARLALA